MRRWQPRYDASGQPICFKCQKVGHVARFCVTPHPGQAQDHVLPASPAAGADGAVQMLEQQGSLHGGSEVSVSNRFWVKCVLRYGEFFL